MMQQLLCIGGRVYHTHEKLSKVRLKMSKLVQSFRNNKLRIHVFTKVHRSFAYHDTQL